jgi:predicted Zn-dependent peptidase
MAVDGFVCAATSTKAENVGATAGEIFDQLEGLRRHPPDAREFEIAHSSVRVTRGLDLETNADIATALVELVGLRLPPDELAASFGKLDAVTAEDVQMIATEQMTTQRTAMVIVGPAQSLLPQLAARGLTPVVLP